MTARATYCERLSALDTAFLDVEGHGTHMHIGSLAVYGDCASCTASWGTWKKPTARCSPAVKRAQG